MVVIGIVVRVEELGFKLQSNSLVSIRFDYYIYDKDLVIIF